MLKSVITVVEVDQEHGRIDAPAFRRLEAHPSASGQLIATIRVVAMQEHVATEPIALILLHPDAKRTRIGARDCTADDAASTPLIVLSHRDFGRRVEVAPGIARLHLDDATERVGAVSRALRTPQHLDLLDIEERCRHADATQVDVVDQETDRRVGRALVLLEFADAAQLEIARPRTCRRPSSGSARGRARPAKCCSPASASVVLSSTETLAGTSDERPLAASRRSR